MQRSLMLGKGSRPAFRKFETPDSTETEWVTLDIRVSAKPDVLYDLNDIEKGYPLPFQDNWFDEIHAYSVINLYGQMGDYRGWFLGWNELWRILKPNGFIVAGVPSPNGKWAFGDPATKRVIGPTSLLSLTKEFYEKEPGATDYYSLIDPHWWKIEHSQIIESKDAFYFGLRKIVDAEAKREAA